MSSQRDVGLPDNNQGNETNSTQTMAVLEYNTSNPTQSAALAMQPQPNRERQPQNLQSVLRYSIAATTNNTQSVVPPMDSERRSFLEATLQSLTNNAVDCMSSCLEVLLSEEYQQDETSSEAALEQIIDLVDNMDNAIDFYKIGGFRVIDQGLHSPHDIIRAQTATLLAELSQNNIFIQDRVLETNFLSTLLNLVNTDPVPTVQVKSLYAVSCIVRDHEPALLAFSAQNGWTVLLKALQSSEEKLQLKACFLLSSLCMQNSKVIGELCDLGYVEQLCGLLSSVSQCQLVEHLLQALLSMASNSKQVVEICSSPQLQMRRTLSNVLETAEKDMDDYKYAQQIKSLLFGTSFEDDGER